jgi:hypothetical protein
MMMEDFKADHCNANAIDMEVSRDEDEGTIVIAITEWVETSICRLHLEDAIRLRDWMIEALGSPVR